jgi:hypothetical protein
VSEPRADAFERASALVITGITSFKALEFLARGALIQLSIEY